jgi:hypothetical protein
MSSPVARRARHAGVGLTAVSLLLHLAGKAGTEMK